MVALMSLKKIFSIKGETDWLEMLILSARISLYKEDIIFYMPTYIVEKKNFSLFVKVLSNLCSILYIIAPPT